MKFISKEEAIELIKDNDTLGIGNVGGIWSVPETLLDELEKHYKAKNSPKNLTITTGIVPGDFTDSSFGLNHLREKGLVKGIITSFLNSSSSISNAVYNNEIEGYTLPLGVYNKLLRLAISKDYGYVTDIGLNTLADPRQEGCQANEKSKEEYVKLIEVAGENKLLYKTFKVDICFIKASCADIYGNISIKKDLPIGEQLLLAGAVMNNDGIVIVEVDRVVKKIKKEDILIHNSLVSYIVKSQRRKREKARVKNAGNLTLNNKKICARRAYNELDDDIVINLGVGIPSLVSGVIKEEKCQKNILPTIETGAIGGIPLAGKLFGAAFKPEKIYSTSNMINLYGGGYLDVAILGLAEVDKVGNVNVSKFKGRVTGPGGFIDIVKNTKKIIFVGTFTALGLKEKFKDNNIVITNEGNEKKFKNEIGQVTFSATNAIKKNKEVLYITERAVFKLTSKGLLLVEVAPGIDIEKDIIEQMEFKPLISDDIKLMDKAIFNIKPMYKQKGYAK